MNNFRVIVSLFHLSGKLGPQPRCRSQQTRFEAQKRGRCHKIQFCWIKFDETNSRNVIQGAATEQHKAACVKGYAYKSRAIHKWFNSCKASAGLSNCLQTVSGATRPEKVRCVTLAHSKWFGNLIILPLQSQSRASRRNNSCAGVETPALGHQRAPSGYGRVHSEIAGANEQFVYSTCLQGI